MKKSILIVLALGIITLFVIPVWAKYQQEPKNDKVIKVHESTVNTTESVLIGVSNYLDKSNLPQQEVRQLQAGIKQAFDAIQKDKSDSTLNKK